MAKKEILVRKTRLNRLCSLIDYFPKRRHSLQILLNIIISWCGIKFISSFECYTCSNTQLNL